MRNGEYSGASEKPKNLDEKPKDNYRRNAIIKTLELISAGAIAKTGKVLWDRLNEPNSETRLPKNAEDVAKFLSAKVNIPMQTILTEMEKLKQPGVIEFIYNNVTYILKVDEISDGHIKKANLIAKINRVV